MRIQKLVNDYNKRFKLFKINSDTSLKFHKTFYNAVFFFFFKTFFMGYNRVLVE